MPDYRGTGGTLGGLGDFLQSLAQIADPDKAKRDALEKRLLVDPDLAARLQDNPDQLDQLVGHKNLFGKDQAQELSDRIKNTKLTPQQMADRIRTKSMNAVLNYNNQGNQNTASDVNNIANSVSGVGAGASNIAPPPIPLTAPTTAQQDTYNQSQGLPTTAEAATQKLNQQHMQTLVDSEQSALKDKDTLRKNAQAARDYMAANKLNPYSAFKQIDKLPPDVRTGLTSDPDLKDAIQQGMAEEHFRLNYEQQERLSRHNDKNIMQGARVSSAMSMADKLGVPFDDVYQVTTTPSLLKHYQDNNFKPDGPNDAHLAEAARKISMFSDKYANDQITKAKILFERQRSTYMKDFKKDPEQTVKNINESAASIYGGLGLAAPVYKYDAHPWDPFHEKEVVVSDPGDSRLNYSIPTGKGNDKPEGVTAETLQQAIDSGQADYAATMADPRSEPFRKQLRPPKKK